MAQSSFVIPLADLESGPKHAVYPITREWLSQALAETEAEPSSRTGQLEVELSKNGRQVMVRGQATVSVVMPCSRTLDPVECDLNPEIFLMLAPAAPKAAETPTPKERRKRDPMRSKARHLGSTDNLKGWASDPLLSADEAATDTFEGEQIVLDSFVREFILLDLPMVVTKDDLPLLGDAASAAPPEKGERPVDPRLQPLAEIADRLRKKE